MSDLNLKKPNNTKNQKKPMIKQKKEDVTLSINTNIQMITSSSSTPLSSSSSSTPSYQNYTELKVNEDPEQKRVRLYKTELCRNWEERNTCRYGDKCKYAHGKEDLRSVERHPKYKTEWCHTFETTGTCPYGVRCTFLHSTNQENHSNSSFSSNLIKNHSTPNLNDKRSSIISDISFSNTILSKQHEHEHQQQTRRYSLPYHSSFLPMASPSPSSSCTSNTPTPPPPPLTSTLMNNQRSSSISSSTSTLSCSNNTAAFSSNHFLTSKGNMDFFFNTSPPVSLIPQNLIEDINGPITPSPSIPSNESISSTISYFSNGYSYLPTTFSN